MNFQLAFQAYVASYYRSMWQFRANWQFDKRREKKEEKGERLRPHELLITR